MAPPRSYDDPDAFERLVAGYFDYCDDPANAVMRVHVTGKGQVVQVPIPCPYTMSGLAYYLGIARETLNQYRSESHPCYAEDPEKAKRFADIIARARQRVEGYNVQTALSGCHDSRIAALNLASNFGFTIRSDLNQSGSVKVNVVSYQGSPDVDPLEL